MIAGIVMGCCLAAAAPQAVAEARPGPRIEWGAPQVVGRGGYPRMRVLADGRWALVYSGSDKAPGAVIRFSADKGATWTAPRTAIPDLTVPDGANILRVGVCNSELTQLSPAHPAHPGRLVYSVNLRPHRNRSTVYPFSIGYAVSDDNGATWSPMKVPFQSLTWTNDVLRGCWEPYVQELPGGALHLYFSDETPYWRRGSRDQNISYLVSTDGGDSWSRERMACYTAGGRDGMPVTTVWNGRIYLAVEAHVPGHLDWPMRQRIVSTPLSDPWREPVLADSPCRYDPMAKSLTATDYCGAPYLIQTANHFALSGQYVDRMRDKGRDFLRQAVFPVWVMRKADARADGALTAFANATCPLGDTASVCWSSLTALGGDDLMAVCQRGGDVVLVRGRVR